MVSQIDVQIRSYKANVGPNMNLSVNIFFFMNNPLLSDMKYRLSALSYRNES